HPRPLVPLIPDPRSHIMPELKNDNAPSDDFNQDNPTSEQPEAALPDVSTNGPTPQPPEPIGQQIDSLLEDGDRHLATGLVAGDRDASLGASPLFQQALKGPEIPNAEVSESGVFTVRTSDTEVYETAEVVFGLGLGLDEARPIEWLWPERIPLGSVTILEGA